MVPFTDKNQASPPYSMLQHIANNIDNGGRGLVSEFIWGIVDFFSPDFISVTSHQEDVFNIRTEWHSLFKMPEWLLWPLKVIYSGKIVSSLIFMVIVKYLFGLLWMQLKKVLSLTR